MDTQITAVLLVMAAAVLAAMGGVAAEALRHDMYVYRRKPNGKRGEYLGFAGDPVRLLDGTMSRIPRKPPRTGCLPVLLAAGLATYTALRGWA